MLKILAVTSAAAMLVVLGSSGPAWAQDADAGKRIFVRCQACHNVDKPQNKIGPTLLGVMDRKAGAVEGFKYSDAMKNADIVWNAETIDKYLADPKGYIPGNRMAFPGLKQEEDRKNVIAYVEQASKQ
jgi:cytochrome c